LTLLRMIFRKIIKQGWLQLSILFGLIIVVALVSSIPIYTNAILQRMLMKDMESIQLNNHIYPGALHAQLSLSKDVKQVQAEQQFNDTGAYLENHVKDLSLPVLSYVRKKSTFYYNLIPVDPTKVDATVNRTVSLSAMSGLEQHIRLIDGRMPSASLVNDTFEVLVSNQDLVNLKIVLGNEFTITDGDTKQLIHVKPVGVFEPKDDSDLYWTANGDLGTKDMYINYDLFEKVLTGTRKWRIFSEQWTYALDYSQLKLEQINHFSNLYQSLEGYFDRYFIQTKEYTLEAPIVDTLHSYETKKRQLSILLWSLYVPMMVLLGFYLFMVENLMIGRQKNEISVLRSRGASRWQIIFGYIVECLILGFAAVCLGLPLAVFLTNILGASNGFLGFVQRASLNPRLSYEAVKYALITAAGSVVIALIPAIQATRQSIVSYKRSLARGQKQSIPHKLFLDVILLVVSFYGLYIFKQRTESLSSLGLDSLNFSVNPLLFLIPSLFIMGISLFAMRIYPWIIRFIYRIGRKWWSPSAYTSLIQVSRSSVNYQFLMIFIAMTMASGLFSASAARTINNNFEDQIHYQIGADMVLTTDWENDAPRNKADQLETGQLTQYKVPDFSIYSQMNGVAHAAKVFKKNDAFLAIGNRTAEITLMGIDTDDFGNTAWLRNRVMIYPFNDYLNLIAADPSSVLISRSIAEEMGVKAGDQISIGWDGAHYGIFHIFAIIDYWPSWNPNPDQTVNNALNPSDNKPTRPMLVVGNLPYIQRNIALEPYQVWLKLQPNTESQQIYDELAKQHIPLISLKDEKQETIKSKTDPFRLAINGVMTLGFVMSILICFFGFLLYWLLTLTRRTLQFGILRAVGMSLRELIGMLFIEQLLTTGAAVISGVIAGLWASWLFVPLFQISFNPATQALPFKVINDTGDERLLYFIVVFMIALALIIIAGLLSHIRVHQALKLGED